MSFTCIFSDKTVPALLRAGLSNVLLFSTLLLHGDGIEPNAKLAPLPASPHSFQVVSHRGSHLKKAPENSLQSIEAAIADGADYVEMDIRRTRDGVHFLMHDSKPRRMLPDAPDLPLSQLAWADIKDLKLKAPAGSDLPPTTVPTFEAALRACKGRIRIYLDFKDGDRAAVAAMIVKEGMEKQVAVYDGVGAIPLWRSVTPRFPLIVSPPRDATASADALKAWLTANPVEVLDRVDSQYSTALVDAAHSMGTAVWPDTLGKNDRREDWEGAAANGVDGVQTDHPEDVNRWRTARAGR
jgi:glycerophosphoryl diester phosphodiesterase